MLVSDGGAVFGSASDGGLLQRLGRYVDIVGQQAAALRKRWLISNFLDGTMQGTYWGIGSATTSYARGIGRLPRRSWSRTLIAPIRTDLDAFSEAEIAMLENHGYAIADAAIATHLPQLSRPRTRRRRRRRIHAGSTRPRSAPRLASSAERRSSDDGEETDHG